MNLARNLKIECISRLNPQPPLQLGPQQTVGEAVRLMQQKGSGCLLVCEGERLVGIFTENDLLRRVLAPRLPLTTPLAACMTPDPITVQPRDSISAAVRKMQKGGYRRLPVVDEAGCAVGILSVKQIVHYIVEHFPTTVYNVPPDPDRVQERPEGA